MINYFDRSKQCTDDSIQMLKYIKETFCFVITKIFSRSASVHTASTYQYPVNFSIHSSILEGLGDYTWQPLIHKLKNKYLNLHFNVCTCICVVFTQGNWNGYIHIFITALTFTCVCTMYHTPLNTPVTPTILKQD